MGIFCLRAIDAILCFWIVSLLLSKEHPEKKDYSRYYEHHFENGCFELAENICCRIGIYRCNPRK